MKTCSLMVFFLDDKSQAYNHRSWYKVRYKKKNKKGAFVPLEKDRECNKISSVDISLYFMEHNFIEMNFNGS